MTEEKKNKNNSSDDQDMMKLVDNLNRKDDVNLNRRAFLKASFGTTVAIGLATTPFGVMSAVQNDKDDSERVEIADANELAVGEAKNFSYPTEGDTAVLVRTPDDKYVAYNNKCTHLQCPVFYEHKDNVLLCPCHKGYFDVNNGHPIAGPPQRELPKILVEVKDGKVFAVGREYRHG
ncbi:Ferredoxin subunit of nitrite reductase or a ring-hydroxylating dioxygenase [Mesobacillus persicus]|uniref:Ferredoxin subunit of nitrite reductase or a ring-hydroxylating dioxygenase n=1 Tax=Mesobacillus persicus TaxID=930146 RepID=A0A1H8CU46_9BACI|nr:Rieske 2Fe-2S domain-containing protein [Mesobacillus persicus]SEM98409.1 Ferredoxin subunit of nitrite reductase or a ring-hydroxylating dioxygenase [Mesobacillus persicus]